MLFNRIMILKQVLYEKEDTPYQVSDTGIVLKKNGNGYMSQHENNGYMRVNLYIGDKYRFLSVHRVVAEAFIPNPDNLPQVNHKDKNRINNRVSNLEWVTASENINHSYKHGRNKKGSVINARCDNFILEFDSVVEAAKEFCDIDNILSVKNRIINAAKENIEYKGYIWSYKNSSEKVSDGIPIKDYPKYRITKDGQVIGQRFGTVLKPFYVNKHSVVILCNENGKKAHYISKLLRENF